MRDEMKIQLDVQRKMQVATADIQGEAQLRSSRYSIKAQELQGKAQMAQQQEMAQVQQQQAQEQAAAQGGQPQSPLTPAQRAPNAQTPEAGQQNAAAQQQQQPAQQPPQEEQPQEQAQQTPGMPQGATAYDENAQTPGQALPVAMAGMTSPLAMGAGGIDLRYVAQRAKAFLETIGEEQGEAQKQQELMKMRTDNPPLYQLVIQLMNEDKGSQINPLNAMKAPVPAGGTQRAAGRQIG